MRSLESRGRLEDTALAFEILQQLISAEVSDILTENDNTGEVKLHIRKQRNGPTGMVPLTFRERFTRFENAAPESATKGGERVNGRNAAPNAGNPFA